MTVKLGLVDSGVAEQQAQYVHSSCGFNVDEMVAIQPDPLGHGTATCDIIRHHAPAVTLYNAQVFDARGVTTAATVAAAIDWLRQEKVDLINLSLGLGHDRPVLREACHQAISAGIILIASSPAQGNAVYPSAYDGVIRGTGDARCAVGDISFLDSKQADFGGCPRAINVPENQPPRIGGASMGTAHISGHAAAYLLAGGDREHVREWLVSQAKYLHSERRME
ncbi:MAG: S8 family serine peptidase [Emcibacter sp.]|nr:S8 family serine peptidase [Emcibacter sp.]